MLTYTFMSYKDFGEIIAIHEETMVVDPKIHVEGKDYFQVLLQWHGQRPLSVKEIRAQILEANECNDLKLTRQRLHVWTPLLKQAVQELQKRINTRIGINPPYSV